MVESTPQYVLMDGNRRIGPKVVRSETGEDCLPIYGFSAAGAYEKFRLHSEQALTPYPLVKVYLQMQVDDSGDDLKLVVVDAVGPHDLNLHAATMEAVLEAHENRTNHVTARYLLTFDQELSAYKLKRFLCDSLAIAFPAQRLRMVPAEESRRRGSRFFRRDFRTTG